ncbi:hypothetical protein PIB30_034408 [Stylosanthes scabra]|uniref:ADP-ribosyl cyclase/cyclic ADP-ribose hydrolase n=1 Tax=Stylosanthes scabra TaxID=79078 RepID=A0ABU6ZC26_9FABA|nr:hypothetical protein [Stylosanthes scabra]
MASASCSTSIPPPPQPPTSSYTYHVFLSFRGEDTRNGFTSHLYAALNRKGLTTYRDDKNLRKGDVISDELVKAIEESMFAVIVFSPDYASSSWCLDELCKIIECKNKLGLQMVEVFYDVEPCDMRHQLGTFKEAFEKHEGRHESEKVKRWRNALKQVAAYSAWSSKNQDEAVLVEKIAQHIFETLIPKLPSSMKDLVGIESRVEKVISQIGLGLNDIRYIGIWGMGGMGKTTIARAIFESIRSRFEVTCFLADVREQCEKQNVAHIQKQLLDQMNMSSNAVHNEYDGRTIIQNSLCLKKVLLVLDDVNDEKQLENLAGEQNWFGPGSRIIITTRDIHLLKEQEVCEIYEVEGLGKAEAFNLFCLKAFKHPEPTEGFLDLSEEVVKYSGGLPLALKVLGSHLFGRSIEVWRSAIEDIKKSSHSKIIDVLKISYNGLRTTEKDIFLDIACFFKGELKDYVTEVLERCGHNAEIGIDILINRSLVTINKNAFLGMHDLVEEMGKLIVIEESPNDVSKRSRLWCYEDIDSVILSQKQEIEATQSMVLHLHWWDTEENWSDLDIRGLSFSKLQLLILDGVYAPILYNIPSTLKVLRWRECPMETLCLTDQRYELVEIDLSGSEIVQLWEGKKFLSKLEHLNLPGCYMLEEIPDLSGAPNLKTLVLEDCDQLNYIHPSLTDHKSLVELNLRECNHLETLGDKLEMSSLKKLDLSWCTSLRRVPEFGECMKQLSILYFGLEDIGELPRTFGNLVGLTELYLDVQYIGAPISLGCFVCLKKLWLYFDAYNYRHEIHNTDVLLSSVSLLTSLTSLTLNECFLESQESIHHYDLGHLPFLTNLDLSYNSFKRVPISIHQLPKLTQLQLINCSKLEVLPDLPSSLRVLDASGCDSLAASNVNDVISKAWCFFAESTSQDGEDVFEMVITGKEIPAWFEHQEQGNGVSVPFPHNCPSTQTMALSLCFVFDGQCYVVKPSMICCNGKEFINKSLLKVLPWIDSGNMCIVFLNGYFFSNLLGQHNRFHILFNHTYNIDIPVTRSAAHWVCNQDIQDFKKRKATLQLSKQDMMPLYEEDEGCASHQSSHKTELLPLFPLLPGFHNTHFS